MFNIACSADGPDTHKEISEQSEFTVYQLEYGRRYHREELGTVNRFMRQGIRLQRVTLTCAGKPLEESKYEATIYDILGNPIRANLGSGLEKKMRVLIKETLLEEEAKKAVRDIFSSKTDT
jgi:hypothetical protein